MDENKTLSLDCQKQKLVALNGFDKAPNLVLAHDRVGLFETEKVGATQTIDLGIFLANVKKLGDEMKKQLIGMDEAVDVLLLGLISGVNVFLLSLPGAAKSTMARMLAKGVDGKLFQRVMNPDMSRNDIFGMIDPLGMKEGIWRRKRDGVAAPDCRIALFDEIYKSSGQVRSMILEVLEEHHFTEGVTTIPLDLLMGIGASNELVGPTPRNADWDRFGIRYEVKYLSRVNDLRKLFTAGSGRVPIQTKLSPDEILLVQALVEVMSMNPSKKLADTAAKILGELNDKELQVSPRRIQAWLRVTAAKAILERGAGAEAEPRDLLVGENILWITPESRQKVAEIVNGISDPDRQELMRIKADYETLRNQTRKIASLSDQTNILAKVNGLKKNVEKKESTDFVELRVQIEELREKILSIEIK